MYNILIKPNTSSHRPGFRGFIPGFGLLNGSDNDDFILIYEADFIEIMTSYNNGAKLGPRFMNEIKEYLSSVSAASLNYNIEEIL